MLQFNGRLGHFAQQIAVAFCHSLHGDTFGAHIEWLSVELALLSGLATVERIENLSHWCSRGDGHVGVEILVVELDGRLCSSRDLGLRVHQHADGIVQQLRSSSIGQCLLCVRNKQIAVVRHVVSVDGNILAIHDSSQDLVFSKVVFKRHAFETVHIGNLNRRDFVAFINRQAAEQGVVNVYQLCELLFAIANGSIAPCGIDGGVQVQCGHERLERWHRHWLRLS